MLAATRALLTALDPLSYPARMRHLARWAATAPERAAVCAELRAGNAYERHLALTAAMVAGDAEGIRAATQDPQPSLRAAALVAALRTGTFVPAGIDLSAMERRRVYRTLRRLRAPEVADALLAPIRAAYGDEEAAALLPACSPDLVRDQLPDLEHALNPRRLVRRHAEPLLERAGQRLARAAPEHRARVWTELGTAVLECAPDAALELVERFAPEDRLPGDLSSYRKIAARHPQRVAQLLAAPARAAWLRRATLSPGLLRQLAKLPGEDLAPIARRLHDRPRMLAALLDALPPARRGELYDAALTDVDAALFVPTPQVVETLPAAVRIREAARVLTLRQTRDDEWQTLLWSSYLSWPEASAALQDALRSGDAEVRARAYRLLVDAARRSRDPQVVADLVTRLGRLRNEQDPVRAVALGALAGVARLLTADTADGLTRIVTDAVEARDASATTMSALSTLAVDTLQHHVGVPALREWALLAIDLLTSGANVPVLRRFDSVLRRGQEHDVVTRLRPWVRAAAERGRYGPLFALTQALGKRAWQVPELQEMLRHAVDRTSVSWVAAQAIELWLDNPRTRGDRVAEVLSYDRSTVTIPAVWHTLSSVRTDLLDRVLDRAPRGRFLDAGVRWVPSTARLDRWLPRQQGAYLALQQRIIEDDGTEVWRRAAALRAVAVVPGAGRDLLLRYADAPGVPIVPGAGQDLVPRYADAPGAPVVPGAGRDLLLRYADATEVPIAEAALGALAWTDRPDLALPALLAHAGGDRARVAMYAAGRAARHVPPSQLPALLVPVLTAAAGKVTSRKEAARLLARFGPPGVMTTLLTAYQDPAAHRDVRAAIVSAARQRPADEDSWAVLATAVRGSREECRAVLATTPWALPERFRPRYAQLIVAACQVLDRSLRRAAFVQLPLWARWATEATALVEDRLTDLGEPLVAGEFAPLVPALGDAGLRGVFDRLLAQDLADQDPGGPATDHPARRRIETLARGIIPWARTTRASVNRSALLASARRLADRPGYRATAVPMLIALGRLDNLPEIADLCADRPVLAARAADQIGSRLRELPELLDPARLRGPVAALAAREDLAGGLIAVALVRPGASFGWPAPWRTLLLDLRNHRIAEVAEEAWAVDMTS
ncbi:hypothetical protein [Actinoplanes sp. N902-109]|uniref:hypothetical protein n=1 Tax=Actinoplanes sp. (strain N902-109) TaxID=649831 RepID=UPI0003295426|nr:hypothetical protein [Actinoplanes sp. N902-109]AGL15789.1 hypothetical protein L083_2279 [Actinoplanes sp. N902-109]